MLDYIIAAISPTSLGRYLGIFNWLVVFLIPTSIMQWLLTVSILRVDWKWLRLIPWVILGFIGSFIGSLFIVLANSIFSGKDWGVLQPTIGLLLTVVMGLSYGIGIGIGQWVCLPNKRKNFWWVVVNSIGFVVAYGLLLLR